MGEYNIAVIPGDGIGPEVTKMAMQALQTVGEKYGHSFHFQEMLAGGCAIDATGECLPNETIEVCRRSDAVLLGAVGGPKWDVIPGHQRPEKALLGLRSQLGLYANLRPAIIHKALSAACPLKPEIVGGDLDILIVRELTGGIYFGEQGMRDGKNGKEAYDIECYSEQEISRIAKRAFQTAQLRRKQVVSVDKANVLESSRLWRKVVTEVAKDYPDVTLQHMYVDNAAMQLVRNPKQFDVIVTSNLFGDILSDEASMITGSIGLLPSASLGESGFGMFEPIHGSAPDIAGKDMANPIAAILSAAMMLTYSFGLSKEGAAIQAAVENTLDAGCRTPDIQQMGMATIGTVAMGNEICKRIQ